MSSIRSVISELLAKLATLQVTNGQGQTVSLYTRVWNNQFLLEDQGKIDAFPRPCAFVEILKDSGGDSSLGQGFSGYDVTFRIHLSHEQYDAMDGTMEQDLDIFDLKDEVIALLTYYEMSYCSGLMCINEGQDYSHTNVYHYTVDFICHFIEGAGDQTTGQRLTTPPTALEVNGSIISKRPGQGVMETDNEEEILTDDDLTIEA